MFDRQTHISFPSLLAAMACLSAPLICSAAAPVKLSGVIGGVVTNSLGVPQMGASVVLYNHQDRICDKVLTDEKGEFRFPSLFPDLYSIRVNLAAFMPAVKKNILVQPGLRALLNVNLNSLFSSIQIAYPIDDKATFMTDDWKWMLRTASATRPVLRFLDEKPNSRSTPRPAIFSDTRGLLQVSAGDGPVTTGVGNQADLGTAFALATSVYGHSQLELSGNLGYGSQTGVPAAAFRTSYSRGGDSVPEISVTMRQLLLPERTGAGDAALPILRSVEASMDQRTEISDQATLRYGVTMDSVSFGDRMNYFSPYARLTYALGDKGEVAVAYTSGNARPDLGASEAENSDLQRSLDTIGLFPAMSLLNGRPRIQRGNEFELSYARKLGSRTAEVSVYHETVSNAALSVVGPAGAFGSADLLPDLFTGNATLNAGNYQSNGFTAALTQRLGDNFNATVMYGTMAGLTMPSQDLVSSSPDELRSMIRAGRRQAITARIAATAPWSGTRVTASYQFLADNGWVTVGNLYTTQAFRPLPGLNLCVRQPLPFFTGLPWRVEATADLTNLLADGYLPLNANGQQLLLVQTPRSFRGGFSFIF